MRHRRGPIAVGVELIQDLSAVSSPLQGYLRRHRHRLKTLLSDGTRTDTMIHDFVDREPSKRDAVAIAVWSRTRSGVKVLLRRQLRYGAYLVSGRALTTEVLAGLIESGELPEQAAAREVREEAGIDAEPGHVVRLGAPLFAIPSIMTEVLVPTAIEVSEEVLEAAADSPVSGDGSPFEAGADHLAVTLGEAMAMTEMDFHTARDDAVFIADMKSEVVLSRLGRWLSGP